MNKKSIISLIKELKTFLKEKRKLSYEDPSINPVSSLAHLLSRKFVNDEIDFPKINSIIEHLSQELILQRASNLNKNNSFKIKKTISKITKEITYKLLGPIKSSGLQTKLVQFLLRIPLLILMIRHGIILLLQVN